MTYLFDACPVCGTEHSLVYRLPNTDIVRCKANTCGLAFAQKQPDDVRLQAIYNEIYYDNSHSPQKPNSERDKFMQHLQAIDRAIGLQDKRILDYGCGLGNALEAARDLGFNNSCGVELNDRAREQARQKGFHVVKQLVELEGDTFDVIYMNDVIEHVRDPITTLTEIKRFLRPGGHLVMITMNIRGLKARILGSRWSLITDPTHFYFFDACSLSAVLRTAGFGQIEIQKWPVTFGHHGPIRALLQQFLVSMGFDTGLKVIATSSKDEQSALA